MIKTSNIPSDLLDITKKAVDFYVKTFMTKRAAARIDRIKIGFRSFKTDEADPVEDIAWADYEEDGNRLPSDFTIIFNNTYRDIPIREYLSTLFHEMTHINQYLTGRLKSRHLGYVWLGEKVDPTKIEYWDHPWEREAIALETVAYAKFDTAYPELDLKRWKPVYYGRSASGWQTPVGQVPQETPVKSTT